MRNNTEEISADLLIKQLAKKISEIELENASLRVLLDQKNKKTTVENESKEGGS